MYVYRCFLHDEWPIVDSSVNNIVCVFPIPHAGPTIQS